MGGLCGFGYGKKKKKKKKGNSWLWVWGHCMTEGCYWET